ncbi:hypothetical protein [Mucilaginibacter sp.]
MNILYVLGGIASLIFGTWLTIKEINVYRAGEQDKLGADIKMLGGALMLVMVGVALILKYI